MVIIMISLIRQVSFDQSEYDDCFDVVDLRVRKLALDQGVNQIECDHGDHYDHA